MTAMTIMTAFFTFFSGPFGAAIIALCVLIALFQMGAERRASHLAMPLLAGVGFFSIAWIFSNFFGATIG